MRFSFDPVDPFPLLSSLEGTYEAAKLHSMQVDDFLGFRIPEAEAELLSEPAPWAGLPPSILLTPYTELRFLLDRITPPEGSSLIELGSGYSRLAHVLHRHFPHVHYLGFELIPGRAREAIRVMAAHGLGGGKARRTIECVDVLYRDPFPGGECYFLYDLSPSWEDTGKVLRKIREIARTRPVRVIGRGRSTRTWIERKHPWLSEVHPPEHHGNFTIYRS
jgi:hypothetical protein